MQTQTVEETLTVLGEASANPHVREEAYHNLMRMDPEKVIPQLIEALRSDNFTLRWESARVLTAMGRPALIGLLRALVDPARVGDSRLRSGIYQVLHHQRDPVTREITQHLLQALHGPAPDLEAMREASLLLQELTSRGDAQDIF